RSEESGQAKPEANMPRNVRAPVTPVRKVPAATKMATATVGLVELTSTLSTRAVASAVVARVSFSRRLVGAHNAVAPAAVGTSTPPIPGPEKAMTAPARRPTTALAPTTRRSGSGLHSGQRDTMGWSVTSVAVGGGVTAAATGATVGG